VTKNLSNKGKNERVINSVENKKTRADGDEMR